MEKSADVLARGCLCSDTGAQQRAVFMEEALNICLIYNINVSVEVQLSWPLWSDSEDNSTLLRPARAPWGGSGTRVSPFGHLAAQLFWSVLHVWVLLEEGKGDSDEHRCHAVRTSCAVQRAPSLRQSYLHCSTKALGVWACPVPQ